MQTLKVQRSVMLAVCIGVFFLAGCTTLEKSTDDQKSGTSTANSERIASEVKSRADSIAARSQAESRISPPPKVTGKYAVQVGAYTTPENAVNAADLAKVRFNLLVYTFHDRTDNLYKVYIGDFLIKDNARNYRDDMVRGYPGEYNDAWVSEHPPR